MEYEIERFTRRCAASGRELGPGEEYYSVLVAEGATLRRYDYAAEAWQGAPAECIGWWKARVPDPRNRRKHWAPSEVMLMCFDDLVEKPGQEDMLYVLALLLVRRRIMLLEEIRRDPLGREVLILHCPRREATYRVSVVMPEQTRLKAIQMELEKLLQ
jgi:hypothetical protein